MPLKWALAVREAAAGHRLGALEGGGGGQGGFRRDGTSEAAPEAVRSAVGGGSKAVRGGFCQLQMPVKLAVAVRETVAGHRLGALERGGVPPPLSMHPCCAGPLFGVFGEELFPTPEMPEGNSVDNNVRAACMSIACRSNDRRYALPRVCAWRPATDACCRCVPWVKVRIRNRLTPAPTKTK